MDLRCFCFNLLSAIVLIVSCSKAETVGAVSQNNSSVILYANEYNASKTILNNDYSVRWNNNDSITVFMAEAGKAAYSLNLKFKIKDASAGAFAPANGVSIPYEGACDWFVCSPYQKWCTGPVRGGSVTLAGTQRQSGYSSSAHVGANDIMVGKVLSTASPSVELKHLGTLMKFTVKNATSSDVSISKITINAGETVIAGAYKVDFTSVSPSLSSSYMGSSSYTSVKLLVENGGILSPDATADFYVNLAPFTIAAGKKIIITVEGSHGICSKNLTPSTDLVFEAGKCNTASMDYTGDPDSNPTKFTVEKNASGNWKLYKWTGENKSLFYIKGAASNNFYSLVDDFGGNVFRTYSINAQTADILDQAYANGLYVYMGISIGRETDGFDYNNAEAVAAQLERVRQQVTEHYHRSSILCWCIGNEVDSRYTNPKVWSAINDIAAMIHSIDPNHPITTALAGTKESAVREIITMAPQLDFLSINSYYNATSLVKSSLQSYGWTKPWLLSEFGPRGTWALSSGTEPPLTSWNACIEQTSTQKADIYKSIIADAINANQDNGCIGSTVFLWGYQKHGAVLTWYGLFDKNGYSFGAVDEMTYAWTGSYPENPAPVIQNRHSMTMNGKIADDNIIVAPSSSNTATVTATSPCGVTLTYHWLIYKEGTAASDGSLPDGISGLIVNNSLSTISFTAPSAVGNYRLVVFAKDDTNKKVASAVIPFQVK